MRKFTIATKTVCDLKKVKNNEDCNKGYFNLSVLTESEMKELSDLIGVKPDLMAINPTIVHNDNEIYYTYFVRCVESQSCWKKLTNLRAILFLTEKYDIKKYFKEILK
jgi:hypothetical protein